MDVLEVRMTLLSSPLFVSQVPKADLSRVLTQLEKEMSTMSVEDKGDGGTSGANHNFGLMQECVGLELLHYGRLNLLIASLLRSHT